MHRALLFVPLLAACSVDQGFGKTGDAYGVEGPMIEVSPSMLDFGALADGETASGTFTVSNIGPSDSVLEVEEITIGGADGGFTLLSADLSFSLPGGASAEVEVAFTPVGANEQQATAIVPSNDESQPQVTVDLFGEGLVPELEITPDPLDLGTAYVGCDKDHDVTLTNVGTDTLIIDSIGHVGDGWTLTDENVLPLELAPEASTTVNVLFTPTEEGASDGVLTVTSNEPLGTRRAEQTAEGAFAGEYEDEFEVPTDPPADIIFLVDQSCSMDDDQRSLATNFSVFIAELSNYTTNWHVMVVNDDDGCNNSGVLQSTTSDYEGRFTSAVSRGGGNYTEALLYVAWAAIDDTDSGDCNDNFLREAAMLHIIMVTDEPEQSPSTWDTYVNRVISKKGDASLVRFSGVLGTDPGSYTDAISFTGGEALSITSDWSSSVESLATASVEMTTFELTRTPVPETIAVSVNGSARSGGWSYDSASNEIVFEEARMPEEGDTVTVTYAGLASCD